MVDSVPDYCPFCGARLRADGLDAHLDRHDDCANRFSAWREKTGDGTSAVDGVGVAGRDLVRAAALAVIVAILLAYSLIVAQQLLLGIIASAIVIVAFVVAAR